MVPGVAQFANEAGLPSVFSTVVCRGKRLRGSLQFRELYYFVSCIIASKLPLGVGFWRRIELLVN